MTMKDRLARLNRCCALLCPALVLGHAVQSLQAASVQPGQQQGGWVQGFSQQWSRDGRSMTQQPSRNPSASCARSGYVYLECQEPSAELADPGLNSNPSYLLSASVQQLEEECEYVSSCVAFSTSGVLYVASAKTGRVGPLSRMHSCVVLDSLSRGQQQCKGTYVFDGSLKHESLVVSAENGTSSNSYPTTRVRLHKRATSVPIKLTQQYVRGQARGGPGHTGVSQCSVC